MDELYYSSIEELPLDEWNGEDGDNSIHAATPKVLTFTQADVDREVRGLSSASKSAPSAKYVPFKRNIYPGSVGYDSFAVKRALSKAGYGKWGGWGVRNLFGPFAVKNLQAFEKAQKLPQNKIYELVDHKKLSPYFDPYGIFLLGQVHILSAEDVKRNAIVATAMVGYANRYSIHYTQSPLRMQGVRNHLLPPRFPNYEDCSSFSTWCYWVAGVLDPNGLNYNGEGYTGTLVNHGRRVTLAQAKPGDLVFYGWRDGIPTHVAVYIGNGRVISHGSEAGPLLLSVNYRTITEIRSYV